MADWVHVIDDDDAVRDSLAFLLETADLSVRTYASAVEFLEAVPIMPHGCIVTDVRMPQMSGVDLARRLKELQAQVDAGEVNLLQLYEQIGPIFKAEQEARSRRNGFVDHERR